MQADPDAFVRTLLPALRQAAAIARALEGRVRNRPKGGERNETKAALTVADSAAQEAILVPLLAHFPEVRLEAEEDTPSVRRFATRSDAVVVVDPIDGTLHSYLQGLGPYAVLVGLALGGRYEAALVALPREDLIFQAVRGRGAHLAPERGELRPVRTGGEGRRVLVSYGMPRTVEERLRGRGFEVGYGCGGAIAVAPLLPGVVGGIRLAGEAGSISIRGRIGLLVSEEAGGVAVGRRGEPFPDDLHTPAETLIVARDRAVLDALLGAVA